MRRPTIPTVGLALAVASVAGLASGPSASAAPLKLVATIAFPSAEVSTAIGSGNTNASELPEARQTCPEGGQFDGTTFKFFDLKAGYTKVKAYGPQVVFSQSPAGLTLNDYDIDLYILDAKCNLLPSSGTKNAGGAFETASARPANPARYAVINYYYGPYANLAVTLEASN